ADSATRVALLTGRTPGRVEQRALARAGRQRAGQQRDAGGRVGAAELTALRERAEERIDRARVLTREHLRRRQQRSLSPGVHRLQHRPECDDGLARTDLAL